MGLSTLPSGGTSSACRKYLYGVPVMRFNTAIAPALYASALLASTALAQEDAEPSSSVVERPTFTPTSLKAPFLEQFTDDWDSRWTPSHAKKQDSKSDEDWAYVGEWSVEEPTVLPGLVGDKGLVVKNAAAHHAISAKFPKKIDNKGKTLVVQYEVKLQNGLECGGAYLKLLRDNKALHQEEFSNVSPYVVMFGPDKCGSTNKVHLIINHKNPKTGEYEEKHLATAPAARIVKTTELYTLIIHPNNTAIIKLNGEQVKEANLLEDFQPAFNPPKEIDDAKDTKPDTWVDEARIPDPEATKPEDWDEDAPFEIVDEAATKPEDWLEDEPLSIPDPEAVKPEDWDDEEDGDWIAPTVSNPKCDEVSGCGPWEKPMIKNPEYKGKWTAPYIGNSVADAEKFADETFNEKHPIEQLIEIAEKPKVDETKPPRSPSDLVFTEDPIHYIKEKLDLFFTIAQNDPIQAIKFVPEAAGGLAAVLVTFIALIVGIIGMSGSSAPPQVKKAVEKTKAAAVDAKDKVAEAAASGVEQAKAEKRSTRSTS